MYVQCLLPFLVPMHGLRASDLVCSYAPQFSTAGVSPHRLECTSGIIRHVHSHELVHAGLMNAATCTPRRFLPAKSASKFDEFYQHPLIAMVYAEEAARLEAGLLIACVADGSSCVPEFYLGITCSIVDTSCSLYAAHGCYAYQTCALPHGRSIYMTPLCCCLGSVEEALHGSGYRRRDMSSQKKNQCSLGLALPSTRGGFGQFSQVPRGHAGVRLYFR